MWICLAGEKHPFPCPLGSNRLYVVGGTSCLHARMQMVMITCSAMTQSALYTVCTGGEHRTSILRSEERWETVYRQSGPLSRGRRGGGRQCTETMDFYLKVKGKMDTQYRDTQDVYLRVRGEVGKCKVTQEIYQQVRGEVGDRVQSLRTSICR